MRATTAPRAVEERHVPYATIQKLIGELSKKYGVAVRQSPQVKSQAESSPRPPFLEEAAFLRKHVDGIRFPYTVPFQEYDGDPEKQPVVMKNETVCKGQQKYLIEYRKQLGRFRTWMESHGKPTDWNAQEYIESPGEAPAAFRVLVDCTGHIVASQIAYGPPRSMRLRKDTATERDVDKDPSKLLELPGSDVFINAQAIASNHMLLRPDDSTIGGRITLDRLPISHPYNSTERHILHAHGLDTDNPLLPNEVARIASGVGKALGMKGKDVHELVLGVDIIQKRGTKEFYVLEANRRPSLVAVRDMLGSADSAKEVNVWRWLISGALQRAVQVAKK